MKYYIFLEDMQDYLIRRQKKLIYKYIENNHINIVEEFTEYKIDKIIDQLQPDDILIVASLYMLGTSSIKILESLQKAYQKKISIYLVNENLLISDRNQVLASFINSLYNINNLRKRQRVRSAQNTRLKNGTITGRKRGKKTKSIFDKHKRKIMKLYNQGVPKTKILAEIKKDDKRLEHSSPQALGQYIKKTGYVKKNIIFHIDDFI